MGFQSVSVEEFHGGSDKDRDFVDVRSPAEFQSAHPEGARNVPLDRLDPSEFPQNGNSRTVYLICQSGTRAKMAQEKLDKAGCQNAIVVEGGLNAWKTAGLPTIEGKGVISLERQVRIAAGTLVLVGVLLGFLVHPVAFGLSGFVGAGLVFAGVTDTCGMGILLSKMPWNQVTTESGTQKCSA